MPFALIRPPGHHATPDRAMGFCLFNNIAIAAAAPLQQGYERVAIVDWDVHHGNGTQAAFYAEPRVLFVSCTSGRTIPAAASSPSAARAKPRAHWSTCRCPTGATDGDYAHAFDAVVEPVVRQFAPQAILVSAGMDIHRADPLGGMRVTEAGFAHMGLRCARLAKDLCEGRLAFILEGGYDRGATSAAVEAVLRAVADETAPPVGEGTVKAAAAIERARETQSAYWKV